MLVNGYLGKQLGILKELTEKIPVNMKRAKISRMWLTESERRVSHFRYEERLTRMLTPVILSSAILEFEGNNLGTRN